MVLKNQAFCFCKITENISASFIFFQFFQKNTENMGLAIDISNNG